MRKIIFAILLATFAIAVNAQSSIPRTGNLPGQDNSYRVLTGAYILSGQDAVGTDTVKLVPIQYHTTIAVDSLLDSVSYNVTSVKNSYCGDEIVFLVTNTSTGKAIKWAGPNWAPAVTTTGGTFYPTASRRSTIKFVFDGVKWCEVGRSQD